jgi:hypothetical protein
MGSQECHRAKGTRRPAIVACQEKSMSGCFRADKVWVDPAVDGVGKEIRYADTNC